MFMLQYRTNAGERRKPALGLFSELTVEQARRSEIVLLEWEWIDLENRRVVWPDNKTGGMSKPMSEEAYRLLSTAPRQEGNPYVPPSPRHPVEHLTTGEYYGGWRYIHTGDDLVRKAAEMLTNRRKTITGAQRAEEVTT